MALKNYKQMSVHEIAAAFLPRQNADRLIVEIQQEIDAEWDRETIIPKMWKKLEEDPDLLEKILHAEIKDLEDLPYTEAGARSAIMIKLVEAKIRKTFQAVLSEKLRTESGKTQRALSRKLEKGARPVVFKRRPNSGP